MESVLWFPVFIAIFALIVDVSLIFNTQASITRLIQDANRAYAIGRITSAADAETYVKSRLGAAKDDPDTTVSTTINSAGIITTAVSVEAGHYMSVGLFTALTGMKLRIVSQHYKEN